MFEPAARGGFAAVLALGMIATAVGSSPPTGREQGERSRHVAVSATMCGYDPTHVEANRGDLITVLFHANDVAHSFVIDDYRIAKRAQAGQTVTLEFLAERAGQFSYYCNIEHEHTCAQSRGLLVVY